MKKLFALLLALTMLAAVFTGCGASYEKGAYATQDSAAEAPMMKEEAAVEEEMFYDEDAVVQYSTAGGTTTDGKMEAQEVNTYAEKIIYSGHSYMETTEFDEALVALENAVKEFGGFVQDSNVNGTTQRNSDGTTKVVNRWGYYVVRIPTARFDEFMLLTEGIGNVTSSGRTAENVTSQYTDYEARLSSLKTQEERLLSMLEESGDLESLIALEARLSEVRYEIESIERNLRNLDQRLAYSTVNLEIQEVEIYTPTATTQRSFGEKIGDAFRDSWKGFARGWQNFTVGLVYALPTLLLLGVLAAAVIGFIAGFRKRRKARKAKAETEE